MEENPNPEDISGQEAVSPTENVPPNLAISRPPEQVGELHPEQWFADDQAESSPPAKRSAHFSKPRIIIVAVVFVCLLFAGAGYAAVFNKTSEVNSADSSQDQISEMAENGQDTTEQGTGDQATDQPTEAQSGTTNKTNTTSGSTSSGSSSQPTNSTNTVTHVMNFTFNGCYVASNGSHDITIKAGEIIKFVNKDTKKGMYPASDSHPSHNLYSEFDPGKSIAPGGSWSFAFNKKGAWGYHDHNKPTCTGKITVQ